MRVPYSTKLQELLVKTLKHQAVDEDRSANEIVEEALKDYFAKKGVAIETKK